MKLADVEAQLLLAVQQANRYFDEELPKLPPQEALRQYARLKAAYDGVSKNLKLLTELQQRLQYRDMPDIMVRNGIRTYTDDVLNVRFGMSSRFSAKILDKPTAYEWLRQNGHGSLIVETVNAQTLGAFAGSYIEETGCDLPSEIFEVKQSRYTTVTKVSKK